MSINDGAIYIDHGTAVEDLCSEITPLLRNQAEDPRAKGASFTSSVFNLMNAIMGSGILGLAYAMSNTGIVGFCVLLLLVSTMAAYSINLLLKLCDLTGIHSYEGLGDRALKKPGKVLVGVTILIQNIGAMSSYMFILKMELPAAITGFLTPESSGWAWYEDGRTLLVLVTVCVVLPLALLTKIGFLGYSSSLAFLFMLFFTVVVVVKKWSIPCPLPSNVTITHISNTSESECTPKLIVLSSKARKVFVVLFCGDGAFSWAHHILSTLLILSVALLLAIFAPDFKNVFGVVGSTTSTCLLFVFPGVFYLRLSKQPIKSLDSVGAVCLLVFGLFVGVLSLSVIVVTWAQNP